MWPCPPSAWGPQPWCPPDPCWPVPDPCFAPPTISALNSGTIPVNNLPATNSFTLSGGVGWWNATIAHTSTSPVALVPETYSPSAAPQTIVINIPVGAVVGDVIVIGILIVVDKNVIASASRNITVVA